MIIRYGNMRIVVTINRIFVPDLKHLRRSLVSAAQGTLRSPALRPRTSPFGGRHFLFVVNADRGRDALNPNAHSVLLHNHSI